jgi:hypothetical protein
VFRLPPRPVTLGAGVRFSSSANGLETVALALLFWLERIMTFITTGARSYRVAQSLVIATGAGAPVATVGSSQYGQPTGTRMAQDGQ